MKVTMLNRNTKKVELDFSIEVDRSSVEFTERMIAIRLRNPPVTEDLIRRTEIEIVIEAMDNSGIFEKYPRTVVIID